MRKYLRGVTLIELMVVIVIIAILAAVGYPSYRQYVAKAKRNEAKAALLQIAQLQERHYLQQRTYSNDLTDLGFPVATNYLTDSESYIVNVTSADASTWEAEAVYQKADAEADKCATFSINAVNEKSSTPHDDCWTNTRR